MACMELLKYSLSLAYGDDDYSSFQEKFIISDNFFMEIPMRNWFGNPVCTTCWSEHRSSSCAVASQRELDPACCCISYAHELCKA